MADDMKELKSVADFVGGGRCELLPALFVRWRPYVKKENDLFIKINCWYLLSLRLNSICAPKQKRLENVT